MVKVEGGGQWEYAGVKEKLPLYDSLKEKIEELYEDIAYKIGTYLGVKKVYLGKIKWGLVKDEVVIEPGEVVPLIWIQLSDVMVELLDIMRVVGIEAELLPDGVWENMIRYRGDIKKVKRYCGLYGRNITGDGEYFYTGNDLVPITKELMLKITKPELRRAVEMWEGKEDISLRISSLMGTPEEFDAVLDRDGVYIKTGYRPIKRRGLPHNLRDR